MGLKLQTLSHFFVLSFVYLCCDDAPVISLHEFKSKFQVISNFINDEPLDDILIIGDLTLIHLKEDFSIFLKVKW